MRLEVKEEAQLLMSKPSHAAESSLMSESSIQRRPMTSRLYHE